MPRLRLTLQYDGTAYAGWQVQRNGPSIQAAVQQAFATLQLGDVPVTGASRTDAGVHAAGQVCHVDVERAFDSPARLVRGLNGVLARDIRVLDAAEAAPDFHARHDATAKTYRYLIATESAPPLLRRAVWEYGMPLDVALMTDAAAALRGEHDFGAFQAAGGGQDDTVRTVFDVRVGPAAYAGMTAQDVPLLAFDICANGFLYKMVRSLVGTLVDMGASRLPADTLHARLQDQRREKAGRTAPARGLSLCRVSYAPGPHSLAP